ncbi:MAG: ribosome maturation factor RimM [Candidatus Aminicenantes bacterium]|nr:ribosome maturation factor RimM [Candidatus Aminicenantes bacterium]MDH5705101.1 ribosome maturation factor RimM [Candidatus Aminicenantes bacterium]
MFFSRVFLQVKGSFKEYRVESLRSYKEFYRIKLEGIDTLPQAREMVGLEVLLPDEGFQDLEEDNYYVFQIIGCSVVTKSGEEVGTVTNLWLVPENDLLVVTKGKTEILIPFSHSVCLEVDLELKKIKIDPPEGLLDLNEI